MQAPGQACYLAHRKLWAQRDSFCRHYSLENRNGTKDFDESDNESLPSPPTFEVWNVHECEDDDDFDNDEFLCHWLKRWN